MKRYESWGDRARRVIVQVLSDNPDLSGPELKKKLSQAYPFGEREYHPYKVWLREVGRALTQRAIGRQNVAARTQVIREQGELL